MPSFELPGQFCNSNSQLVLSQRCTVKIGGEFVRIQQLRYVKCHHVPTKKQKKFYMKELKANEDRVRAGQVNDSFIKKEEIGKVCHDIFLALY